MKLFQLISLVAIAAIGIIDSALAQTISVRRMRDQEGRLYILTGTPQTTIEIEFRDSPLTRRVLANPCGMMIVRPLESAVIPSKVVTPSGTQITPSTLTVKAIPRCINGTIEGGNPTANFRTNTNIVVLINQTPNLAQNVVVTGKRTRSFTSNSCGVVRVANSTSFNMGDFYKIVGAGDFGWFVSSLQIGTPLCRNNELWLPKNFFNFGGFQGLG